MRKVLVFSDFVKGLENRWGISENKSTILRYQYQRCVDIKKKKKTTAQARTEHAHI